MGAPGKEELQLSAAEKQALEVATDVASQIRRVLDGLRTFPPGHKTLTGYFQSLHERLVQVIASRKREDDEYLLGVTPLGLKWGTHILNPAESLADSFTHPLYLDGVHQIAFSEGLAMSDLTVFTDIWRNTLDNKLGETHTFCTRYWEADLATIHVMAAETFSEGGASDGKTKSELQAAVEVFSGLSGAAADGAAMMGVSGIYTGSVSRVSHITRADLDQLRAQGIPEMTQEDLARYDSTERAAVAALSPDELARLANELATLTSQQIERATEAMFQSGVRASPEELASLQRAFALVVSAMVKQGMIGRLKDTLAHRVAAARQGDASQIAARFEVLTRLLSCLSLPMVLEPLVVALDDAAQAAHAAGVLRFLPAQTTTTLLNWLTVPETETGRRALSEAIMARTPSPEDLVQRMGWADDELALELLHISSALSHRAGWPVRRAGLTHPSPAVRRAAVSNLPKEIIVGFRHQLIPLLASPDPAVRGPLFAPLLATGDKSIAQALANLLKQQLPDPERRRALIALGTVGGEDACAALRNEFTTQKDPEIKCVAASALGNAGDEKARPLLAEAAGKLFGGGELKKAAAAALKRLDLRKAGAKS